MHASTLQVILPVGISFYTFQTLSYSIDIYRGNLEATRDLRRLWRLRLVLPAARRRLQMSLGAMGNGTATFHLCNIRRKPIHASFVANFCPKPRARFKTSFGFV